MTPPIGKERRVNFPQELSPDFWLSLQAHMSGEDEKFREGADRMERIEADLRPIKKMYWAVVGSASVGILLLATMIYVYQSDKSMFQEARMETKELASAIHKQGIVLERLMISHQMLDNDYRRTVDRLDQMGHTRK